MNSMLRNTCLVFAVAGLIGLGGCGGMSRQEKNTAYGATAGGVAGAVITGGGALGTLGGAAVGGLIGHEITKDKNKD